MAFLVIENVYKNFMKSHSQFWVQNQKMRKINSKYANLLKY